MRTIRELREERRWTQLQLANELRVTPVTVYNWERGKYEPSASMFRQIARVFGVSMDDIRLVGEALPEEPPVATGHHSAEITDASDRANAVRLGGKLRAANGR